MRFRDLALVDTASAKSLNLIISMKIFLKKIAGNCKKIMRFRDLALVDTAKSLNLIISMKIFLKKMLATVKRS